MRTTNPIANLFGWSPIRPLQKHMEAVEACAAEVIPLFEALGRLDRETILSHKERIFELEQTSDDLKNDIRSHLPKSLFMPVDRRDFLDMLNAQDSIADTVQDIAGLLVTRRMTIPEPLAQDLPAYVRRNVDAVHRCRRIIDEFNDLLAASFRGRSADRVVEMIDELGRIETETDDQGLELMRLLFAHEDELKPLTVVFWYQLIELIGDIADYAEDVGDRLRLLIAR